MTTEIIIIVAALCALAGLFVVAALCGLAGLFVWALCRSAAAADAARTEIDHYVTPTDGCSACGCSLDDEVLDDLDAFDFQVDDNGWEPGTPFGPPVYWAEGTIACPACGARLWVQVAS